jgi:DNA-binding XRE family transcriptional regulator
VSIKSGEIKMNICADRLKTLRISHGFTQKQIGSLIGLSDNGIISIEKGRNKTTLDNAVKPFRDHWSQKNERE